MKPLSAAAANRARRLGRAFYQRPTRSVARDLLGKLLVHDHADGLVAVRLSEVEAYLGPGDRAAHTFGGRRTDRVATMWGEAGHAYVYFIYGMHTCLNVVTVGGGAGEAVLVRGAAIAAGAEVVRRRRGPRPRDADLLNGPGKLCQALAVDLAMDGDDLCDGGALWIGDDGFLLADDAVTTTPRIGLGRVGEAARWPLRFVADFG